MYIFILIIVSAVIFYISRSFFRKKETNFVLKQTRELGLSLENTFKLYRSNYEIVLASVKNDGYEWIFASNKLKEDPDIMREAIRQNKELLEHIPAKLKADKDFIISILPINIAVLKETSDELKKSKDIARLAMDESIKAYDYLDDSLKNDDEFILRVIQDNAYSSYNYNKFPKNIQNRRDIALEAVNSDAETLEYLTKDFQDDIEIVTKAVILNGKTLKYASNRLCKNKEITYTAIKNHYAAFKYIDDTLKEDIDFIQKMMKATSSIYFNFNQNHELDKEFIYTILEKYPYLFKDENESIRKDKKLTLRLIQTGYLNENDIHHSLKNDKDVLRAIALLNSPIENFDETSTNKQYVRRALFDGQDFSTINPLLQHDKEFILSLNYKDYFHKVPIELREDKDFIIKVIKTSYLPDRLNGFIAEHKKDKEIAKQIAINNSNFFEFVDESFRADKKFVLSLIRNERLRLQFVSDSLKSDKAFILKATRYNIKNFKFIDSKLKDDKEFILEVLRNTDSYFFSDVLPHINSRLLKDKEIVFTAVSRNPSEIEYADDSLKLDKIFMLHLLSKGISFKDFDETLKDDKEMALMAVENEGRNIKYLSSRLKKDREVVFKALSNEPFAFEHIDESLKEDREIILYALHRHSSVFEYLSDKLKNDFEIAMIAIKLSSSNLEDVSKELQDNKELVLEAVVNGASLHNSISSRLRADKEVALSALKHSYSHDEYDCLDESLKKDSELKMLGNQITKDELLELSNLGDAMATYYLASVYEQKEDYLTAFKYYEASANASYVQAYYQIGQMYEYEQLSSDESDMKAFEYYEKGAELGSFDAQLSLATFYYDGTVGEKNLELAKVWCEKALEQEGEKKREVLFQYATVLDDLGEIDKAILYYKKAIEYYNPTAAYYLGYLYKKENKIEEAKHYLHLALYHGETIAAVDLAELYHYQEKDYSLAAKYYKKELTNQHAAFQYAHMHYNGDGVVQDDNVAFYWFEYSANKGYSYAQYELAWMYRDGLGVKKDRKKALNWMQKSAEQDNELAIKDIIKF